MFNGLIVPLVVWTDLLLHVDIDRGVTMDSILLVVTFHRVNDRQRTKNLWTELFSTTDGRAWSSILWPDDY